VVKYFNLLLVSHYFSYIFDYEMFKVNEGASTSAQADAMVSF